MNTRILKCLFLLITLLLTSCSNEKGPGKATPPIPTPAPAEPTPVPEPPPPPPEPEETMAQKLAKLGFPEAVEFVKPMMSDEMNETSKGAVMLAVWGMQKMVWTDVFVAKNETSFALVQKDPDEARGKRMCTSGTIIQIEVTKTDFGKVNEGLLRTNSGNLFNYNMVGGSGELVARSRAKMCGVVIGKYSYSNSGGGTGHAVQLVGMFDLPENKK